MWPFQELKMLPKVAQRKWFCDNWGFHFDPGGTLFGYFSMQLDLTCTRENQILIRQRESNFADWVFVAYFVYLADFVFLCIWHTLHSLQFYIICVFCIFCLFCNFAHLNLFWVERDHVFCFALLFWVARERLISGFALLFWVARDQLLASRYYLSSAR
jgi:hypothetical protein